MQIQQCHEILQLSPNASEKQIKQAYYRTARLYHPDISDNPDSEKFIKIHNAYKSLIRAKRRQCRELSLYCMPMPLYRRLYQWLNKKLKSFKLSWREVLLFLVLVLLLVPGYYRAQAWQQQTMNVPLIQKQRAAKERQLQNLKIAYQQCFSNVSISAQTQCVIAKQQKIAELNKNDFNFSKNYQGLIQAAIQQHEFYYAEQLLETWEKFEQLSQQAILWHHLAVEREVISLPPPTLAVTKPVQPKKIDKTMQLKPQLEQCEQHLQANRLTRGYQGYALQCYQNLAKVYPNHQAIDVGLAKIEQRLVNLARNALKQHRMSQAKTYIASLKKVNRHSSNLSHLQHKMRAVQKSVIAKANTQVITKKATVKNISAKCRRLLRQFSIGMRPLSHQEKNYISQQCQ
ncbi:J domain-containing protein [Candidatus Albibeggiatoa sp. nov. BB20]|uniref:J domain-containing protein n=1 Tax=Candidatus Albibeggiatoa sp. nov. BB20 TaxID=3162723 RepID=UPI003365703E